MHLTRVDVHVAGAMNTSSDNYIGCYSDAIVRRDLYGFSSSSGKNTIDSCVASCASAGYLFAGMQQSYYCYCGNYYGLYGLAGDSACNSACPGSKSSMCGGNLTSSVYKTGLQMNMPSPGNYMGCWQDWTRRDLSGYFYKDSALTVESCLARCTAGQYMYAAMQVGKTCFCGDSYGKYGAKSYDLFCNLTCAGNAYQRCGANMASSVYSTGVVKSKLA